MSGYRTIHRQVVNENAGEEKRKDATWSICFSPCNQSYTQARNSSTSVTAPLRLLASSSDGLVRAFTIVDKSTAAAKDILDASALSMKLKQVLLPTLNTVYPPPGDDKSLTFSLGCAAISSVRNYVGEDPCAGGEVTSALRLDGYISIWLRDEQPLYPEKDAEEIDKNEKVLKPYHEFKVENAAGTTMLLLPPQLTGYLRNGIILMVGCLDGSVAFLCTGVGIPDVRKGNDTSKFGDAGTILDKVGSGSCPMSLALSSKTYLTFAVGRKNGVIDIYSTYHSNSSNQRDSVFGQFRRSHRLSNHMGSPVRALTFTPDGSLLISACDDGHIYIHDTSSFGQNESIRLVASIMNAHKSYILSIAALTDSRRFVTSSADKTVKVWDVSTPNSGAVHTFDTGHDDMIWDVSSSFDGRRCASCGDDGLIQIYSCDA